MDNSKVLVTKDYIMKHRTKRGAWTRAQMLALGVGWPQPAGWIDEAVGTHISIEDANKFEAGKNKYSGKMNNFKKLLASLNNLNREQLLTVRNKCNQLLGKRG